MDRSVTALVWIHLTARVHPRLLPLCRDEVAHWWWSRAREAFPDAIGVTLMPDHPHLVVPTADPDASVRRLGRLFGHLGRRFGIGGEASRVAPPKIILPGDKLSRQVRYVALNPCRDHLVKCPLAWTWSTHRDVVGAIVDPWVDADRLARAVRMPVRGFAIRHHAFVSGDPDASVDSTPFPVAAPSTTLAQFPLRRIAEAAATALRVPIAAIRARGPARTLFVALAIDQGWDRPQQLATQCDVQPRAIRRLAKEADERALRAARLCLGDARLRIAVAPADTARRALGESGR